MTQPQKSVPIVLAFCDNDPSGGAGVQAAIETLASIGCHCAPVITSTTVHITSTSKVQEATPAKIVKEQACTVLQDLPIAAFRIGHAGSLENIKAIQEILLNFPEIPVVLDPALNTGRSQPKPEITKAIYELLCPLATILSANTQEARLLTNCEDIDACGNALLEHGCDYALLSGTHEVTPTIINYFFGEGELIETFSWERHAANFHGAGTTLSSAIAGMLAHQLEPFPAVNEAQEYTWESLKHGYCLGNYQFVPNRFFWAHEGEHESDRSLN